ncbi:hypothetical protein ACET3Z_032777 [Daucus carota]
MLSPSSTFPHNINKKKALARYYCALRSFMGEEKKEEEKREEEKKEEANGGGGDKKQQEEKKEQEEEPLVLKVDMHCEACARKVTRSLKGFQGVEQVTADCKASKVVVKGKTADPIKVCERIQKKSGRKVEIISPLPKPPEENKVQEAKQEEPPKEEKKDEPPLVVTVVLKIGMHCEACAQVLQKRIRKIKGVESVTIDLANDRVTVKGILDPEKLVVDVYKKTKKQAIVVKDEEKKEEGKKEEEKKEDKETKKEGEEAKEDDQDNKGMDIMKNEYYGPKSYTEYSTYVPQLFSDENPNACSVIFPANFPSLGECHIHVFRVADVAYICFKSSELFSSSSPSSYGSALLVMDKGNRPSNLIHSHRLQSRFASHTAAIRRSCKLLNKISTYQNKLESLEKDHGWIFKL